MTKHSSFEAFKSKMYVALKSGNMTLFLTDLCILQLLPIDNFYKSVLTQ